MKFDATALSATIVFLVLFTTRGHGAFCGSYKSCQACLADDGCVYVLGRITGEADNRFFCTNHTASRSVITTYAKFRRPQDCLHVGDVTEPSISGGQTDEMNSGKADIWSPEEDTVEMMANLHNCPIASPLLIAFFVSSLLLAISVTVMCTLFCWPTTDADHKIKSQKESRDTKDKERNEARQDDGLVHPQDIV